MACCRENRRGICGLYRRCLMQMRSPAVTAEQTIAEALRRRTIPVSSSSAQRSSREQRACSLPRFGADLAPTLTVSAG